MEGLTEAHAIRWLQALVHVYENRNNVKLKYRIVKKEPLDNKKKKNTLLPKEAS